MSGAVFNPIAGVFVGGAATIPHASSAIQSNVVHCQGEGPANCTSDRPKDIGSGIARMAKVSSEGQSVTSSSIASPLAPSVFIPKFSSLISQAIARIKASIDSVVDSMQVGLMLNAGMVPAFAGEAGLIGGVDAQMIGLGPVGSGGDRIEKRIDRFYALYLQRMEEGKFQHLRGGPISRERFATYDGSRGAKSPYHRFRRIELMGLWPGTNVIIQHSSETFYSLTPATIVRITTTCKVAHADGFHDSLEAAMDEEYITHWNPGPMWPISHGNPKKVQREDVEAMMNEISKDRTLIPGDVEGKFEGAVEGLVSVVLDDVKGHQKYSDKIDAKKIARYKAYLWAERNSPNL